MSKTVCGIDFGTTNTSVAVVRDHGPAKLITLDQSARNPFILRSVIYVPKSGGFLFGDEAVKSYNSDVALNKAAHEEVIHTKTLIKVSSAPSARSGFKPDEIVEMVYEAEVSEAGRLLQGMKSLLGRNIISSVSIFEKRYTIEELVALFLREVRDRINAELEVDINSVVIGRPVKFVGKDNKLAVEQLLQAAHIAGFTDVKLELEPIGAAYDFEVLSNKPETVLVFDFGGGTLDLSVVKFPEKNVIISQGIGLGGDLINSRIFTEEIAKYFGRGELYGINQLPMPESIYHDLQHWYSISLLKTREFAASLDDFKFYNTNPTSISNLKSLVFDNLGFSLYEAIDGIKKGLSENNSAEFDFLLPSSRIRQTILRSHFEKILQFDLDNIRRLIKKTLTDAKLKNVDIDRVVMTGGSSLIPSVKNILVENFGEEKLVSTNAFTSVASGLAVYADKVFN